MKNFIEKAIAAIKESDSDKAEKQIKRKIKSSKIDADRELLERGNKIDDLTEEMEEKMYNPDISFEQLIEDELTLRILEKEFSAVEKLYQIRYEDKES